MCLTMSQVNNATARVQTKKPPTVPNVCVQWPEGRCQRGATFACRLLVVASLQLGWQINRCLPPLSNVLTCFELPLCLPHCLCCNLILHVLLCYRHHDYIIHIVCL
ncbi:hypothetical protein B7P43_G07648 [Cryptotermes secundus]|uniref:Uncharacterized protein n=1 Tax=Cryptotermes secundus TaxID=105785 RepID=A0A2J7R2Z5_9NEOP|nr:hypothetical protein B7P43_G07648 [Cryptotermes secundus]